MARTRSALKRARQAAKRRARSKAVKSAIKTLIKRYRQESDPAKKEELLRRIYSALDKAAKRRIYHPNTAARKKSALARELRGG